MIDNTAAYSIATELKDRKKVVKIGLVRMQMEILSFALNCKQIILGKEDDVFYHRKQTNGPQVGV